MPEDVLAHVQRPRPAPRPPGPRAAELAAALSGCLVDFRPGHPSFATLLAHAPRADRRVVHAAPCEQFSELTLAIAMINGWNRLAIAFRKRPEQAA